MLTISPTSEATLVELIQKAQCQKGSDSIGELYKLYSKRVFYYLLTQTHTEDMAEELVSQVFLRLIEKIHLYRVAPQDNILIFPAWLLRMAHNCLINSWRKQNVKVIPLEDLETKEERGEVFTYYADQYRWYMDEASSGDDLNWITKKLSSLNSQQRQVVTLRFMEGLSVSETASTMQKSESAVKMIQHRAITNLRQMLDRPSFL